MFCSMEFNKRIQWNCLDDILTFRYCAKWWALLFVLFSASSIGQKRTLMECNLMRVAGPEAWVCHGKCQRECRSWNWRQAGLSLTNNSNLSTKKGKNEAEPNPSCCCFCEKEIRSQRNLFHRNESRESGTSNERFHASVAGAFIGQQSSHRASN